MLFPTVTFAIFFIVVFTTNWLTMLHPRVWRWLMLGSSYFFYGWWDWRFVPLLAGSAVVNHFLVSAIARTRHHRSPRELVAVAVVANLGVLAVFKYYGFFASSVVNGLRQLGIEANLPLMQFVLPVGISFFTFQALSYVIDVYRGDARPAPLLDTALYLAFFPQLVAGPIVRATELLPQFAGPRNPRQIDAGRAFHLIVVGLFKKIVLADFLARSIVDPVFSGPSNASALEALAAIYGFAVQIFCDFSAYTDIAIGVALLLGFKLPDNFDAPYTARGAQDFWRRWHMTLSRWLRDYLYIPLGGSRAGRAATYRNLLATMLLGGLWHGAAWRFVLWGGVHGAWLAAGRWRSDRLERIRRVSDRRDTATAGDGNVTKTSVAVEPPWLALRQRLVTFHLVALAWIPFRADSLGRAWELAGRLVSGWGPSPLVTPAVVLAITSGIAVQYVSPHTIDRVEASFSRLRPAMQGAALALALLVIDSLGAEGVAAFIYFQF